MERGRLNNQNSLLFTFFYLLLDLWGNKPSTLSLIGFRTGGGAALGTKIFVEIPTGQNQEQLFTSRGGRLTGGTKQ